MESSSLFVFLVFFRGKVFLCWDGVEAVGIVVRVVESRFGGFEETACVGRGFAFGRDGGDLLC